MNVELYDKLQSQDAFGAVEKIGRAIAKSGMFGCEREEQGQILAMVCMTEGMSPVQVTNKFHIIGGRLSRKSGSALAEFKKMGGVYKWIKTGQEPEQSGESRVAIGEFSLDGQTVTVSFSMEDASNAKLIRPGSAWQTMPWKMLRARVISDALGMLAPEIYYGDDEAAPLPIKELKIEKETVIENTEDDYTVEEVELIKETAVAFEAEKVVTDSPKVRKAINCLPDETVDQLKTAIGEHMAAAMNYFTAKNWLKEGQGIEELTAKRAENVINRSEKFLNAAIALMETDDGVDNECPTVLVANIKGMPTV